MKVWLTLKVFLNNTCLGADVIATTKELDTIGEAAIVTIFIFLAVEVLNFSDFDSLFVRASSQLRHRCAANKLPNIYCD